MVEGNSSKFFSQLLLGRNEIEWVQNFLLNITMKISNTRICRENELYVEMLIFWGKKINLSLLGDTRIHALSYNIRARYHYDIEPGNILFREDVNLSPPRSREFFFPKQSLCI